MAIRRHAPTQTIWNVAEVVEIKANPPGEAPQAGTKGDQADPQPKPPSPRQLRSRASLSAFNGRYTSQLIPGTKWLPGYRHERAQPGAAPLHGTHRLNGSDEGLERFERRQDVLLNLRMVFWGFAPCNSQVRKDLRLCPTESAGRQASRPAEVPSQMALVGEPCR